MRHLLLFSCLLLSAAAFGQHDLAATEADGTIQFSNPSFEDYARVGFAPKGWTDCGFPGESAVDVQPDPTKEFEVVKQAQHLSTYLGMVTRDNDTHERVSQRISAPLVPGQCYELRVQLARSELYKSKSQMTGRDENYITPIKLRIRGGYSNCDLGEVLGESPLVSNWNWQEYRIKLRPTSAYTHLVLEAFWKQPILFPYNGNVLVDNLRPLEPVACDADLYNPAPDPVTIAEETPPSEPVADDTRAPAARAERPTAAAPAPPPAAGPVVELGKTKAELKIGQVFEIDDITFKTNSAELEQESERALFEIAGFLRNNREVVVEIGGHASYQAGPVYADRISEERAVAVIEYLRSLNIGANQLLPHGYGKTRPLCTEANEECNQRNQRVEVKILRVRPSR